MAIKRSQILEKLESERCVDGVRCATFELNALLASLAFHLNLSLELVCLILYLSDMSRLSLFYDSMGEKNISFASGNQNHLKELVK